MDDIQSLTIVSCTFIVFYSMVSKHFQNAYRITDPLVTLLFGIAVGRAGLGILDMHYVFSKVTLSRSARILLCLQTMAVSLTIPKNYVFKNLKSLFSLVVVLGVMKCIFIFALLKTFSDMQVAACWAIAASLTPTDPILSASIIKGDFSKKHVSEKLRILLNAESGINDGLGIVMLSISTEILKNQNHTLGLINFFIYTLGIKVITSAIIGYLLGHITRILARKCCGLETLRSEVLSVHSFALSFLGLSLMDFIGGSELICIFFIGTALNYDGWYTLESTNKKMAEIVESTFSSVFFVFIGSVIDFRRFTSRMMVFNLLIVFFTRPLSLLIGYKLVPLLKDLKEAMFVGWFGPIGVGALFYCIMYDLEANEVMIDFVMCSVLISTIIHGLSVPIYCITKKIMRKIKVKSS